MMQTKGEDSNALANEILTACEKQFFDGFVSYVAQVNSEIRIAKWHKWNAEIESATNKDPNFKGPDLFTIFGKSVSEYELTDWMGILMVIYNKLGNHYESVQKDMETGANAGITMKNAFLAKTLQNKIANIPEMNTQQLSAVLKEIIDYLKQAQGDEQQSLGNLNQTILNMLQSAA